MLVAITKKSKKAFEKATKKLGLSSELPNVSMLREDLALYITAQYMLAVIIEAGKDGKVHDITDHSKRKYENWHHAEDGYVPGSSSGGFSCSGCDGGNGYSVVGARLSFNSWEEGKANAKEHPDLWEIVMLNVK